jgi:hypothetical protein
MEPTVQTEGIVSNNIPDNIIHDNKQVTCISIDDAFPANRNVIKKRAEKFLKYKDLTIEI